ncbi:MAG: hypothetical protein RLZZ605_1479 [Bacteroidota bacterium]|jgi:hypothetical protein
MEELEQAAQDHHVKFWFSEPSPSSSFISGAEWAQERLFTEEDMIGYWKYAVNLSVKAAQKIEINDIILTPKEWKESLK